jgi:hypothetical protein
VYAAPPAPSTSRVEQKRDVAMRKHRPAVQRERRFANGTRRCRTMFGPVDGAPRAAMSCTHACNLLLPATRMSARREKRHGKTTRNDDDDREVTRL